MFMKFFTDKKISKKIIISIVIVMLFNFTSPTISQADEDDGGALFRPVCELLLTVSDLILGKLQKYFIGIEKIEFDGRTKGFI